MKNNNYRIYLYINKIIIHSRYIQNIKNKKTKKNSIKQKSKISLLTVLSVLLYISTSNKYILNKEMPMTFQVSALLKNSENTFEQSYYSDLLYIISTNTTSKLDIYNLYTSKISVTTNALFYCQKKKISDMLYCHYIEKYQLYNSKKYYYTSKKQLNKLILSLFGNRTSMKILTWNKDKKSAVNSMSRIKTVIMNTNTDIAVINEFNLSQNDDHSLVKIPGFKLLKDNLYKTKGIARTVMYIKDGFIFKRV